MLSLTEILFLTLQERAHYVWNKGMYCYSSWEGNYKITLYWLGNFYAQVWHEESSNLLLDVTLNETMPQ
ncbi:hypothetical protein Q0590_31955 [Rhodocytophaga aerolata]|uniref:Uncharacterized protein n=1 Tax=Rhodocytophaga aerolata TaxID=455078 RepID=A0ABT8RFP7_9BACT|nr:hypothetical protein [Rhodocytophaga aerolata]MDO1450932.1 hypothetical protein [Rhodocytophaga aerolata]